MRSRIDRDTRVQWVELVNPRGGFKSAVPPRDGQKIVGEFDDVAYDSHRHRVRRASKATPRSDAEGRRAGRLDCGWQPPGGVTRTNRRAAGNSPAIRRTQTSGSKPIDGGPAPPQLTFIPEAVITHRVRVSRDGTRVAFVWVSGRDDAQTGRQVMDPSPHQMTNDAIQQMLGPPCRR